MKDEYTTALSYEAQIPTNAGLQNLGLIGGFARRSLVERSTADLESQASNDVDDDRGI